MRTQDYEAMFLLDNAACTADYDGTVGGVDQLLTRSGATIVQKEKWDERKLAYEIRGHKRATYYLVYFRAPTDAVAKIRGDAALSEKILRHLILALEEPIETHVKNRAEERERLAEESRKANLAAGWGERGPDDRPRRRRDEEDGEPFDEGLQGLQGLPAAPEVVEET